MVGPGPPAGIGGSSPRPSPGPIINEQIYAPVAHLQQKIQQRHGELKRREFLLYATKKIRKEKKKIMSLLK